MDRVLTQFDDVVPVPTAAPSVSAWRAREPHGGRPVLIKKLPPGRTRTRATQALALRHPRIVPTRRWMQDDDEFYVVRDWVPGVSLRETLSDQTLRAFDRLHARLLPLLDVLDYAHGQGLAHGAVTAENVLTDERFPGEALLSDFAVPSNETPTRRHDFYGLCGLYKEFLPSRPPDDEAGAAARERLLRNLTETQQTAESAEELRYKLDAVARMADLLGFSAEGLEGEAPPPRQGARLVCAVSPPTATLTPGGGTTVTLGMDNEGDSPLHVTSITSDVVWLNLPNRFSPVTLAPGTGGDLIWTLSGARLEPGVYSAALTIRSNDGLVTSAPPPRTDWPTQIVAVPVLVKGPRTEDEDDDAAEEEAPAEENAPAATASGPAPLAETLPPAPPGPISTSDPGDHRGIVCVQEPDPGLVRYGQTGVLHLGIRNIGPTRLRLDKIRAYPSWLSYPGVFRAVWIEPGEMQFLGLSVAASSLAGGDYRAEVTFTTSVMTETLLGAKPVWRDLSCEVRVRVVRGQGDVLPGGYSRAGCTPVLLLAASSLGLLAAALRFLRGFL